MPRPQDLKLNCVQDLLIAPGVEWLAHACYCFGIVLVKLDILMLSPGA